MSETETSTVEAPRNSLGQFTGSEENFGIKGVEIDQGYVPRLDPVKTDAEPSGDEPWLTSSDDDAIRALARKKYGEPTDEPIKIELVDVDGNPAPENVSQTVEQAAADVASVHAAEAHAAEAAELAALAREVDLARAQALHGDPNVATYYGLDGLEVMANAEAAEKADKASVEGKPADGKSDAKPEIGAGTETSSVEGLAPEVEQALKHPQVRQAIEQELAQVDAAKQQYSQALNVANQYAQASLLDHFPELQGVPVERWAEGIAILHQSDPQRVAHAMGVLQRLDTLQTTQAQWQQRQAIEQQQQFESYAKAEDAKFEQMSEWAGLGKTEQAKVSTAVLEYAGELGIDKPTLVHLMKTNPVMRNAAFQKMMVDAARYRMQKAAPAKAIPKPVPAVQRPGIAQSKSERSGANLGALREKLQSSGSVEDAFALYQAKQRSRR